MDITPAVSPTASSTLVVDYDGDSITDFTLESQENGTATLPPPDLIAPTTVATPTGTLGTNNWYTSNVLVTLTATDTESGIASTSYSLNGGAWLSYTTPFTITTEGTTTLRYYSTDMARNTEVINTLIVKIDKTVPEAQILVSTSTRDLFVQGTDDLGATTVTKDSGGNYTIADQAGHTTKLFFTKSFTGNRLTHAKLTSMQYDAAPKTNIATSSFLYLWDTKTTPPTLVSQTIAVNNTYMITAIYDRIKNKTTVVILKKNVPVQIQTFTGLKIVRLTTSRGVVGYGL
jgi:hypothetical protein